MFNVLFLPFVIQLKEKTKMVLNALCVSKSVAQKDDLDLNELWPQLQDLIKKWLPTTFSKQSSESQIYPNQQVVRFHSLAVFYLSLNALEHPQYLVFTLFSFLLVKGRGGNRRGVWF
jgi:hypothetical protein